MAIHLRSIRNSPSSLSTATVAASGATAIAFVVPAILGRTMFSGASPAVIHHNCRNSPPTNQLAWPDPLAATVGESDDSGYVARWFRFRAFNTTSWPSGVASRGGG